MRDIITNIWAAMNAKTDEVEEHLTALGYFIIITFPVFYFINKFIIGIIGYESLFLRLSIGLLGIFLVLRKYLPGVMKKIIPFILYGSLLYAFPFFFFFMLFNNPDSVIWKVNALSGLFFLSFFLDWREYVAFSVIGFFLAWLAYHLISNGGPLPQDIISLVTMYVNPVIYLALFSRKKDSIVQEKLLAMKALVGTIAHEMRTPFLGIRGTAEYIRKILPILTDSYRKSKEARLDVKPLSEKNLQHLIETPEDLDKITTSASLVIDMLLISLKDYAHISKNFSNCTIEECIEKMFREYPLSAEDKTMIKWKKGANFTFYGNALLMKHVLFNLLKNAVYYVKAANKDKRDISIWTEVTPKGNALYFKDSGMGMSQATVAHIFDRFYTHTRHGSGIGLYFCKSVMESFGGSITCESDEGEYTQFILRFPHIAE